MTTYPGPLARLIQELSKLPGIGEKTAARLAFHMLKGKKEEFSRSPIASANCALRLAFAGAVLVSAKWNRATAKQPSVRDLP